MRSLPLIVALCLMASLEAAEPTIRNLNVRGLQIGGKTKLIIDGDDLGKSPSLLLPFPVKQTLVKGNTDKQAFFEVEATGDVQPGYYPLAVVTDQGISPPVVVAADRLAQQTLSPAVEQLPVALHGTLAGATVTEVTFPGKAGQKVIVEVEAQRLGGKLRPILHLYNAKRLQLVWAWPSATLAGDTRLEATLPADGPYIVTLHDVEYAGPAPGHFRLKIGQWSFVDQVFPPVIAKGQMQPVELVDTSKHVDALAKGGGRFIPLDWPKDGVWSGPRPFVTVSAHAEVVEQPASKTGQDLPAGLVGVSGRLLTDFEEDRYRIPVTPLSKIRLEVFADRLGSPVDAALVIRDAIGKELARAEDSPGTVDPVLEYTVPDKVTSLIVGVVDSRGRGDTRGIYRLVIDPQPALRKGNLQLLTSVSHLTLPVGGRGVIPVIVDRRGDNGKFDLSAVGLPNGIKVENADIPEGADGTLLTLQRTTPEGAATFTKFLGTRADGIQEPVIVRSHPLEKIQPWLAGEFPVAFSSAKAAGFQIDWNNLPPDAGIVPAGKLNLPVKLTRTDVKSPVRLTLVTSQFVPLVNNQPDPAQSIRAEKPVELAANQNDGVMTILNPPVLNSPVYDVTVQADLLAADKRTVLATAFAPVRRMAMRLPIIIAVDGSPKLEATLDAKTGATVKIAGKIERKEGAVGDVIVTLIGFSPGATAAPVTVKAADTAFALNVVLPPNIAPGEFKELKLSASITPDPKQANVRVKSRDVDLTLTVKPAPPPPPAKK
ncbi:hypothetical protein [Zavarzinella formosa]|uniref:hypothetical protein n=1 Tax=Zavarzinella formosa TaxID=360055 RepID=UPI000316D4D2|nr:hypothetical protein [Zavarzinella formosa]